MIKKKTGIIIGGAVVVLVAAAFALPAMLGGKKQEIVAEVPPVVAVENPQVRSIALSSELIGSIEQDSIVYVTPRAAGEMVSVSVQTGDTVTAGQVLGVIDTKQVESSRLSMETAKISYGDAKSNLDRYAVLHAAGDVSDADYQKLVDNVQLAKLQYESAKLGYTIQSENSQITAPISGLVENCSVKLHDVVSPQSQICVISGEGGKGVTFYASERIVDGLKVGDSLTVEKSSVDHEAVITEVSTMIDSDSGLFKVKASISNGENLATGTSVKLSVISQRADDVLTVPVDCIYYEGGAPYVYTYQDGILHRSDVSTGLADSDYIEITSGVDETAMVVTTWTTELYDGSRVTLAESAGAAE